MLARPFRSLAVLHFRQSGVTNVSWCAGNWSGMLTETNDPNGLSDYSVDLAVNTNGFVNLSGNFTGTGWLYALAPPQWRGRRLFLHAIHRQ